MNFRRSVGWKIPAALLGLVFSTVAFAQTVTENAQAVPLVFWNRQVTVFRSNFEQLTTIERARIASVRLDALPVVSPRWEVVATETTRGAYSGVMITANGQYVFAILTTDLDLDSKETLQSASDNAVTQLRAALEARSQQHRPSILLRGIALSIAATFLLVLSLWVLNRIRRSLLARLDEGAQSSTQLKVGGFDLRPLLRGIYIGLAKVAFWIGAATLVYIWLTFVLLRFPYSRPWGEHLGTFLFNVALKLATGLLLSVPGIFTVVVIFLLTRMVVRVINSFFVEVEKGDVDVSWLHRDTVGASRHLIIGAIWIFAITVAYPYIPGSGTDAFKGVSVLVGLMLSLGSAGFVNQVMSGLVLIYSRALRVGEFVRVGEDIGVVSEIGMLSTKILTYKREEITIPSGVMVGAKILNYSRQASGPGAVLGTTVTIGYEAPWRLVHSMLLDAASETDGIRKDPVPRVLQRALSDFFVEYELIFNVDDPAKRLLILSELHTHIQDHFNEESVQMMTPHYESQPHERVFVPKSQWFPKPREVKRN